MGYFPFFMDIEGWQGLIVGGGVTASSKVRKLLPFGPKLTIVAPEISKELLENPEICCLQRIFRDEDIDGRMFVIAASDQREVNAHVGRLCRKRNIPVNVADDKEACSFIFPALVNDGQLTVGISTGGVSPSVSSWIRKKLEAELPEGMDEILESLSAFRALVKERIQDPGKRKEVLQDAAFWCMEEQSPLPGEKII